METFPTKEHYYPTIMVTYKENNPYSKIFVALIALADKKSPYALVLVSSSTQEEAETALRKMDGITDIEKIQPLTQALEILEQAAFEEEPLM